MENGDTELAISEKHRLEEQQRQRRKDHQKNGTDHVPAYFELADEPLTVYLIWKFNVKYCDDRAKNDWYRLVKIY